MRKFFLTLILLFILNIPSFAFDESLSEGMEGLFRHSESVENAFTGQKQITDEEFEKTYQRVKEKQDRKKKKTRPFKGKSFNDETSGEHINETSEKNILLSVPVNLINGDGTELPVGHYKIVGEKNKNDVFLNFYQSSTLVARVPAIETQEDFDEKGINFIKLMPYNEERIKVIFGSMDFNAYTFIRIKERIKD